MPAYTEARIHLLCKKVLDAHGQAEVEETIKQLRAAIEEHIRLASESLSAQASVISVLSGENKKVSPRNIKTGT